MSAEEATIAIPIVRNPIVTRFSFQEDALWLAPVIGERATVPKAAASVVTNQLP
jgi:hypothetical protein